MGEEKPLLMMLLAGFVIVLVMGAIGAMKLLRRWTARLMRRRTPS
jgi:hypothetical protein